MNKQTPIKMISANQSNKKLEYQEQSFTIILNSSNAVPGQPNKYVYPFNGTFNIESNRAKLALSNISCFYSWFNISSTYGNNSFSFTFTDGVGTTTYNVSIPNGYYSVSDLNTYLQSFCITNNLYLVNGSGQNVYYLELLENSTYYSVQLNCYPFPTALPSGWSNPAGLTFPAVASTPQLIVNNSAFGTLIGFNTGTYPSAIQATTYSALSNTTPQINTVSNVVVRCNLLQNNISNPPDVLYSFNASGTPFGGLISSSPFEYNFVDVNSGYYSQLEITLQDQSYVDIPIVDNSGTIIQLSFKMLR